MLPNEILIRILNYLNWQEVILFSRVCRQFEQLIKTHHWLHRVTIKNINMIQLITKKYQFDNYKIKDQKITDTDLSYLSSAHTVDLSDCLNITNAGLSYLLNVQILDLSGCRKITDVGLSHLSKVHTLNIAHCDKITNVGLSYLSEVYTLNLAHCDNITDVGLSHLTNVRILDLTGCDKITDMGLSYLASEAGGISDKIHTINLTGCHIGDTGLSYLREIRTLTVFGDRITYAGLKNLEKIDNLRLRFCNNITDADLICLKKIRKLHVLKYGKSDLDQWL